MIQVKVLVQRVKLIFNNNEQCIHSNYFNNDRQKMQVKQLYLRRSVLV